MCITWLKLYGYCYLINADKLEQYIMLANYNHLYGAVSSRELYTASYITINPMQIIPTEIS